MFFRSPREWKLFHVYYYTWTFATHEFTWNTYIQRKSLNARHFNLKFLLNTETKTKQWASHLFSVTNPLVLSALHNCVDNVHANDEFNSVWLKFLRWQQNNHGNLNMRTICSFVISYTQTYSFFLYFKFNFTAAIFMPVFAKHTHTHNIGQMHNDF